VSLDCARNERSLLAASLAGGNFCALERLVSLAKVTFFFVFLLGRSADELWIAFPRAGPLYELSYGLEDARALPGPLAGHTGQIAEKQDEGAGGSVQFDLQSDEILQGGRAGRQRALLLRQLHGQAEVYQKVLDTQAA